jgi:hypothetical protein
MIVGLVDGDATSMILFFLFGSSATVFLMTELPMLDLALAATVFSYLTVRARFGSVGFTTKVALSLEIHRHGERTDFDGERCGIRVGGRNSKRKKPGIGPI